LIECFELKCRNPSNNWCFAKKRVFLPFISFTGGLATSKPKKMGKGDRRTKKGKIIKGSFGVSRPKKKNKPKTTDKK
jgi:30S ribosomal protein S31